MYQLRRRWSLSVEIFKIFQALALTLLLVLAVTFYSRNPYESRMASVLFFSFALVGVVLFRRSLGLYFKLCRRAGKMRNTAVIIGTAARLARWMTPFGGTIGSAFSRSVSWMIKILIRSER